MKSLPSEPSTHDESPDLPGLRSWRRVYLFVIGSFVLYVVLLTVLSRAFS
jgi:hypothetical protein